MWRKDRRTERDDGRECTTCFNPRRHRLEQRADGETVVVTFHTASGKTRGLEKIGSPVGNILEEYVYDAVGRLTAVKRGGQSDLSLTYDESGRVVDIGESGN
ncbi:MAG: hypothetical protein ACREIA_12325 [Opitutaceae bacterium]